MSNKVTGWLEGLGLGEYAILFTEQRIDFEELIELTDSELKELGIPLGPRKKLLRGIAALQDKIIETDIDISTHSTKHLPSSVTAKISHAERRHLTVMFCDLVGSTALSERLDPEELRGIIGDFHKACASAIVAFDGFIARYMGDGLLVYFGYPTAHEDDAERAVRAGLSIVEAVDGLLTPDSAGLQVRVGIATGLVVAGDTVGEGASEERVVLGDTPNLAARLQVLAKPGQVLIAESTRRLLGEVFRIGDLGPQTLKGISKPVFAYAVKHEQSVESRFEALHGGGLLPLQGRVQELALLLSRWRQARGGEGQCVLITGEAGIGKSRIAYALTDALRDETYTRVRYQCSPYHSDSAFYPAIQQLIHAADVHIDDSDSVKLDKLENLLKLNVQDMTASAPIIAALLGIDGEARYGALSLTPQQQRIRTFDALISQLEGSARKKPVLFLLEDAHWIDPSTLELIELALERTTAASVLLLITARPEFKSGLGVHSHVTQLTLNRLGREDTIALVKGLAGGKALPGQVLAEIITKTDGVPLFVEELTKTVLESEFLRQTATAFVLDRHLPSLAIPATLHDSLLARLDRLGPAKVVAQIGAAIGREFSFKLLTAVTPLSNTVVEQALTQLVGLELAFKRGNPPEATYTFKHALVQDTAYESLLKTERQELHGQIASVLEKQSPEIVHAEPEIVAQHYMKAKLYEPAVKHWGRAGAMAISRSANLEAISHLNRGLDCLESLPAGRERDEQELGIQVSLGGPLISIHGYAAAEVSRAFGRARSLCESLGATEPLFATLSGEFVYHFVRADYSMMRELTEECDRLSEQLPDAAIQLASHRLRAITAMHSGEILRARNEFEHILNKHDPSKHRLQPVQYVHDPKISALTYLAPILWILGFPDQAKRSSVAAFELAKRLDQVNLTVHVQVYAGAGLQELLRNVEAVGEYAASIVELSRKHSLRYWLQNGLILQGWVLAQGEAGDEGCALMRRSISERGGLDVGWYQIRYLCMLVECYLRHKQPVAGLEAIAEARTMMAQTKDQMWCAEVDRLEGELLRETASPSAAENLFKRALALARHQHAKSFELRAAFSLARLWRDFGKRTEARPMIAEIYNWFSEGFDTSDLRDAKALLEELY
jgi:class 3 adenylate cyclase/predicted ATPase